LDCQINAITNALTASVNKLMALYKNNATKNFNAVAKNYTKASSKARNTLQLKHQLV